MMTDRLFHHAALGLAAAAALGLGAPAGAAIKVGPQGAWVDGPEAAAPAKAAKVARRAPESAVLDQANRETNLRKSQGFVTIIGAVALR